MSAHASSSMSSAAAADASAMAWPKLSSRIGITLSLALGFFFPVIAAVTRIEQDYYSQCQYTDDQTCIFALDAIENESFEKERCGDDDDDDALETETNHHL